ncbi:hypothetical protein PGT21_003930 [Puccinia graminis f. sp. tritici]|uniref:Uncharacterized protein n=1 Tax=Puccinia graminis f. sp. tritici TaxID=56615 RepID=A0A5B0MJY2_PUCGR|nr:hypothetical protein PGT21_003930 [Puccinia graminis f. sp. tritici]KAA1135593.1 hypothetical protein PGTUg99_024508 [Puccinia graminis f. sp. tritici]
MDPMDESSVEQLRFSIGTWITDALESIEWVLHLPWKRDIMTNPTAQSDRSLSLLLDSFGAIKTNDDIDDENDDNDDDDDDDEVMIMMMMMMMDGDEANNE